MTPRHLIYGCGALLVVGLILLTIGVVAFFSMRPATSASNPPADIPTTAPSTGNTTGNQPSNNPPVAPTNPPVIPTAPPATGNGNCQGQQQASHDPNSGDWSLNPGTGYLIVHFWTNLAGHSQQERVLELTPGQSVSLKGGGSAWEYASNCNTTASNAFTTNSSSFPPVTLDQLRQEGLVD